MRPTAGSPSKRGSTWPSLTMGVRMAGSSCAATAAARSSAVQVNLPVDVFHVPALQMWTLGTVTRSGTAQLPAGLLHGGAETAKVRVELRGQLRQHGTPPNL